MSTKNVFWILKMHGIKLRFMNWKNVHAFKKNHEFIKNMDFKKITKSFFYTLSEHQRWKHVAHREHQRLEKSQKSQNWKNVLLWLCS